MRPEPPVLETPRLLLRPPALADFERWAELAADAEVTRYIGGLQARAVAWRSFVAMVGMWSLTGIAMFSVIEKASGRWVGRLGPWRLEGWPGNEIGWAFHPDAWGRGYAVEAGVAAIDWAFEHLGWTDVIHCIDPENTPSQALAARLGSQKLRRGQLPPPLQDHVVDLWGQTRVQWVATASARSRART